MTAELILRDKTYSVRAGMTIRSALLKLRIPVESVLAVRDGQLLTDDELLQENDCIRLVAVISGG